MANCKQTANELIQDVFSPTVAVLCSSDVEKICAKNNLTFVEMVQPFCRINSEITIRDPSNVPCSIRNLRVVMKDMFFQSPSVPVGKKMMHDAVASSVSPAGDGILSSSLTSDNYHLKYSATTPWFESYRDVFFQVISPTDHEFVHHFLACIFVVSSSHHDPLSQINDLTQQQMLHQQQNSSHNARWFFSYIFKYYLLLHDMSSENLAKAEAIYQSMKSSFGSSACHLLQINSSCGTEESTRQYEEMNGVSNMPDPWSQFLPKYSSPQDAASSNNAEDSDYEFPHHIQEGPENQYVDGVCVNSNEKPQINHPLLCSSNHVPADELEVGNLTEENSQNSNVRMDKWQKNPNRNKRHGVCLTVSDMDRIRVFVQDFCFQGLVPFVEKQIRILSDQVANRKGIHRTIFGVTKKLFAGNKPGMQGPASTSNSVVYSQDAPELQVRKLGDLAFMFQLYEVAYQAYHNAKRDFNSDQAWLYFAGASEMAALSVFMQGSSSQHEYPARYMESAITTYLYTCKLPELATRATLLSTECLKAKGLHKDAAHQFIRMPNEADLPSALFLEQAAHSFLNCRPPKIRKYAFHNILAGHRFNKCGQRKHALRAYKQAEQVYRERQWNFANDHINYTVGRLSLFLKQLESACQAFKPLLATQSQQPALEQSNYLREYLYVLKQLLSEKPPGIVYELPCLPVPLIDSQSTKVLLGEDNVTNEGCLCVKGRGFERADINNNVWAKLEEIVIIGAQKSLPPFHSPQLQCLTKNTDNSTQPVAVVKEVISVEIVVKNPLSLALTIDNVFLLWTFTSVPENEGTSDPVVVTNEMEFSMATSLSSVVETQVIPHIILDPLQEQKLHLTLKPQKTGELVIQGLAYSLLTQMSYPQVSDANDIADNSMHNSYSTLSLQGKQTIELKGPRMNRTTAERTSRVYATDHRLNIKVVSPMPKLQVKYQSFPDSILCGEVQQISVEFSNIGERLLNRIIVASPTPGLFALGSSDYEAYDHWQIYKGEHRDRKASPVMAEWQYCDWKMEVLMSQGGPCRLQPGESITLPMWLRGPDTPGEYNLDLLFYYETDPSHPKLRHRLLQHSSILIAYPSLTVRASAVKSLILDERLICSSPSSCANSLLLSLEVTNTSEELSELSVSQVSCVSQEWCLCTNEENPMKGLPVIHPRENLHMMLKAVGFDSKTAVSSQKVKVFSHVPLGRIEVDSSTTPWSDFSCRSMLNLPDILSVDLTRKVPENSRKGDLEGSEQEKRLILLLTVIWKAEINQSGKKCLVTGQHHVPIQKCSSSVTPSAANIQPLDAAILSVTAEDEVIQLDATDPCLTGPLVECVMSHPFHVQHDFKRKRLVVVPIEFVAHSTSRTGVHVVVDNTCVPVISQVGTPDDSHVHMPQHFTWVSGSRREIFIKPYGVVRIPLRAAFSSPGTYNLGSLNVNVNSEGKDAIHQYPMSPHLIIISASDMPAD